MAKNIITPRSASSPIAGRGGLIKYICVAHHIQYKQAMTRISNNDSCDLFFMGLDASPLHGHGKDGICQNHVVPTIYNLIINEGNFINKTPVDVKKATK